MRYILTKAEIEGLLQNSKARLDAELVQYDQTKTGDENDAVLRRLAVEANELAALAKQLLYGEYKGSYKDAKNH